MTDRLDGLAEPFDWRPIEHEARMHALSVLDAEEATPLVIGAHIAWVDCKFGMTNEISHVHRVGAPIGDKPYTACHEAIPEAIRRMILTPALLRSIAPCRFCEAEYQRGAKAHAA